MTLKTIKMTNIEQILQAFDDQFYEAPSVYMGVAFGDKDLDQSLKYFIKEALLKVQQETRDEIVSHLLTMRVREKGKLTMKFSNGYTGNVELDSNRSVFYNQAIDDIIQSLTKDDLIKQLKAENIIKTNKDD